jgi:hypothetical protein
MAMATLVATEATSTNAADVCGAAVDLSSMARPRFRL